MISKEEIDRTILELEQKDTTFATCERLAWLYIVRDHLTGQQQAQPQPLDVSGSSEFLQLVDGCDSHAVWYVMDDLMDTVNTLLPNVYNEVLRRISSLKRP